VEHYGIAASYWQIQVTVDSHGVKQWYNHHGGSVSYNHGVFPLITAGLFPNLPDPSETIFHFYNTAGKPSDEMQAVGNDIEVGEHYTFGNAGGSSCIGNVSKVLLWINGNLRRTGRSPGDEAAESMPTCFQI